MSNWPTRSWTLGLLAPVIALHLSNGAFADDLPSFATGGYAAGLRTREMMNIMDTDGDGTISRAEWGAFHEKVFKRLDAHHRGKLDVEIFAGRTKVRLGSDLATGGYSRGLSSAELAHKIDANGDGWVSHDEWMAYQGNVFELMKAKSSHKDGLGSDVMFATGGHSAP